MRQYFALGQIDVSSGTPTSTSCFYITDHVGSVREMTNSGGTIVWQQSFDPYGQPATPIVSTTPPDMGFAGMYQHARSGLNLTLFRAYSPTLGRWLSRDPMGESVGTNLYGYVSNNPICGIDPLGLKPFSYQYKGEQQAVMASLSENNLQAKSHEAGKEIGFYTYKKKGSKCPNDYAYSKPFTSAGLHISAQEWITGQAGIPSDANITGFTHTHPEVAPANFDPTKQQGYWTFSPEDAAGADYTHTNAYLSNQYGQVRYLAPGAASDVIISGPPTPAGQVVQRR